MKNPVAWDRLCESFDTVLPECFPLQHSIIHRFIDNDWFEESSNILFYSTNGFPINLLLDYMFRKKYGPFTKSACQITTGIEYFQSQYFIEFDFNHPNFSKHANECIDVIKQIIQSPCYHLSRHIVILKNVDAIVKHSKQMFRVLLERFSKNAIFICTTSYISKIEAPLLSRFMLVRIPLPSDNEIRKMIEAIGYTAPPELNSDRNVFKTILVIDLIHHHSYSIDNVHNVCKYHFPMFGDLPETINLETIRLLTNKICQTNIPFRNIVMDLLNFVKTDDQKHHFVTAAANLEHMMACTQGGRQVLYIERLLHAALLGQNKSRA